MKFLVKSSFLLCALLGIGALNYGQKKVVILGSSTAAGVGASSYANSWAGLYSSYIASSNGVVINLAVPGYTTYHELPTGTSTPQGKPAIDTAHNITAALKRNPDVIILSLTSNDAAAGFSLSESQANFQSIVAAANAASVPLYITTTAPRNLDDAARNLLMTTRDWITNTYGNKVIDFFSTVSNADGTINQTYNAGDNTHFNDAGHQIFYNRVRSKNILREATVLPLNISVKGFQKALGVQLEWKTFTETDIEKYHVQKSKNGQQFTTVESVTPKKLSENNYTWYDLDASLGNNYYRIAAMSKTGSVEYTAIIKVALGKVEDQVTVFPNPVSEGSLHLQLTNIAPGKYSVTLINKLGQIIYSNNFIYTGGIAKQLIEPKSSFVKGVYHMVIKGEFTSITKQVIKE